jgi:thioredoxin-like negative regulator of GroEL
MQRKLLKFYATWCGPCKLMKPVIDKIARENDLEIFELDIDTEFGNEAADHWGIEMVPTVILLENGEEVARFEGANTKARVEASLFAGVS